MPSGSERELSQFLKNNEILPLPSGWDLQRFRFLFRESKERNGYTPVGDMLSVSEYRGVVPKEYEYEEQRRTREELQNYRVVRPGQLAVNTMWLSHLALGVSDHLGHVSPAYAVYDVSNELDQRFVHHLLRSQYYLKIYLRYLYGIRPNSFQIKSDDWKSIPIIIPPLETQQSIADFLDRQTGSIDRLIEKKKRLLDFASSRVDALVDRAISDPLASWVRFENAVRRVHRPVVLSDHDVLIRLGLYNRGRGVFKKPAANEEGLGDSDFFFVKAGDLILSGQFAWEGAVALATEDEEGCVVSHRYPIYRGKEGVCTAYLLGLLRSNLGNFILNELSQGSAGRNRPLSTWRLGKQKIPIPDSHLQEAVECAVAFECRLKRAVEETIALSRECRSALITAAVTGQLDVTASGTRGRMERRLAEIEEAQA